MAKVSLVAVGYTRKFNLGNYESVGLEATCWVDLEEGDDAAAVMDAHFGLCKAAVKYQYLALRKSLDGRRDRSVDGKTQVPQQ